MQEHAIRKVITDSVIAQAGAWDLTTLVNGIVSGEISRDLFKAVKTIYPTRRVEIIKSKVEPGRSTDLHRIISKHDSFF